MNRFLLLSLTVLLATTTLAQAQRMPVTTTSDAARVQYVQGVNALAHADFARGLTYLNAALTADPSFAMAHMYRAVASSVGRDEHMRQATTHGAHASEAEQQQIESYTANLADDHDREIALLTALAERYPSDPLPMFIVANTEANRGRNAEAVAAVRRALAADPSYAPAYNVIGYAEIAQGNNDDAEQAFREYIRLAPDEANPYDSYGEFLMLAGRLDEAEAQFEMALTKDPTFDVSRTNLARIGIERSDRRFEQAVAAGDADALAALYTRTGRLLPPNEEAVNGRDAIREYWAGFLASGIDGIDLTTGEVFSVDDTATQISNWTVSVDGQIVDSGRATIVWAKVGDEWLYHRDMWSSDRPVTTASN